MSALSQAVEDYLSVRRALGYKLAENGRLLPDFVAYLEAAGASTVTTELAVAWATQPKQHAGVVVAASGDGARLRPPPESPRP